MANTNQPFESSQTLSQNYRWELANEAKFYNLKGLERLVEFDSIILGAKLVDELYKTCEFDNKQRWELLYRGSQNGFGAHDFHAKCDDYTNVLVVIKSRNGNVFGGYSNVSWSLNGPIKDNSAFVYSLVNESNKPEKIKCAKNSSAIEYDSQMGPIFGTVFSISQNSSFVKSGSIFILHGSYKHPDHPEDIRCKFCSESGYFESINSQIEIDNKKAIEFNSFL